MSERENGPEFDEVLASALRRVDAPEGFAAKVLARVDERKPAKLFAFPRMPVWATGAIAAAVIAGALAVGDAHERQVQRRVQAQREFETATRITDQTLEHTREQLARAGISLQD